MSYTDMSFTAMSFTGMSYTDMSCTGMSIHRYAIHVMHRYVVHRNVIHNYARASCCPNASQQSIWASQGRAAEGGITMVVRVVLVGIP